MMGSDRTCPLCNGTSVSSHLESGILSHEGDEYKIVKCNNCELKYTIPLPSDDELKQLYGQEYYVQNKKRLMSSDILRNLFQASVHWQLRRFAKIKEPGRVLDVGCGNGDYLSMLQSLGWKAFGTEFSESAIKLARSKGIEVREEALSKANFQSNFFDLVTLWHVLEHLPNPKEELSEIHRIIREDGLLIVEVPNSDSSTFQLCGKDWYPFDIPRHLQHFNGVTLNQMLELVGFAQVKRWDFLHWHFTFTFYSFMSKLRITRLLNIREYSTTFKRVGFANKLLFLMTGVPILLFALPYSLVNDIIFKNGESIVVAYKKRADS